MIAFDIQNLPLLGKTAILCEPQGISGLIFENKLASVDFSQYARMPHKLQPAFKQLKEYLSGQRRHFSLPLVLQGTVFQKKVLNALQSVPFGSTCSYQALAEKVHSPNAARAVGGVMNKNPLPIFLPCHRVVGKTGALIGFAAGLNYKRALLNLEATTRCI